MGVSDVIHQFVKDPAAALVYGFRWAGDLLAGETIASSVWTVEGTESPSPTLAVDPGTDSIDNTDLTTSVRMIAGTLGKTYLLKNTMTDSDGGVHVRRMEIRIAKT